MRVKSKAFLLVTDRTTRIVGGYHLSLEALIHLPSPQCVPNTSEDAAGEPESTILSPGIVL